MVERVAAAQPSIEQSQCELYAGDDDDDEWKTGSSHGPETEVKGNKMYWLAEMSIEAAS